jgi:hypothetical protein
VLESAVDDLEKMGDQPAGLQVRRRIAEARNLGSLRRQVPDRVVDQVLEGERSD